jgi:predicted kinase
MTKTVYMLVGVPASGKSTWTCCLMDDYVNESVFLYSTDEYIQGAADAEGKTYNDVFQSTIKEATACMNESLAEATFAGMDIFWDQTNLSAKARMGKLSKIPKDYRKVAVVFPIPEAEELQRRLDSRPGKTIPSHVMESMIGNYVPPTRDEGFDEIIEIKE